MAIRPFSRSATLRPAFASSQAAVIPVIPAPTIATSTSRSRWSAGYSVAGLVSIQIERERSEPGGFLLMEHKACKSFTRQAWVLHAIRPGESDDSKTVVQAEAI